VWKELMVDRERRLRRIILVAREVLSKGRGKGAGEAPRQSVESASGVVMTTRALHMPTLKAVAVREAEGGVDRRRAVLEMHCMLQNLEE
jgi:hypothetical protein